jgi:Tfp pilus assembly protein PilF
MRIPKPPIVVQDLTIMVVEENSSMRQMTRDMLKKMGYQRVILAVDGETAIQKIVADDEKPDVVLSNYRLPGIDGFQFLEKLRALEHLSNIAFIIVTGEMDEATVARAGEYEVDGYILRPFTIETLANKIESVYNSKKQVSPIEAHITLGIAHLKNRQFDEAKTQFVKALEVNSGSPRAIAAMAAYYEARDEIPKAKKMYQKAAAIEPRFLKAHEALTRIARKEGDLDAVTKHMKKCVAISPKNLDRQIELGQTLMKNGRADEAEKVFDTTMKLAREENAEVGRRVGETFLAAGMAEHAQKYFTKAIKSNPEDVHLYNRLGITFRKQGKFDEAIENYERALMVLPESEALYYNLALVHAETRNFKKAKISLTNALKINPNLQEAQNLMAQIEKVEAKLAKS